MLESYPAVLSSYSAVIFSSSSSRPSIVFFVWCMVFETSTTLAPLRSWEALTSWPLSSRRAASLVSTLFSISAIRASSGRRARERSAMTSGRSRGEGALHDLVPPADLVEEPLVTALVNDDVVVVENDQPVGQSMEEHLV